MFFSLFLPQFVDPGENTFLPFLVMGITYCIVKAVWFVFYVYMIESIGGFMKKPRVQAAFEGGTGLVFIGFGVKLTL
ncbi:LysE family translocator, partial [Acinetobacter baumannii]|uniref:LysE family translocator n=1 Tax=Acinetobacter baumannii TaxID=470 RepID=UPI0034D3B556